MNAITNIALTLTAITVNVAGEGLAVEYADAAGRVWAREILAETGFSFATERVMVFPFGSRNATQCATMDDARAEMLTYVASVAIA